MSELSDETYAQNAVARFFREVDGGNWQAAADLLCPSIYVDYQSFGGGPPGDRMPHQLIGGWQTLYPGFDHVHHHLGSLETELTDAGARVAAKLIATHVLEGKSWTLLGDYAIQLEGYRTQWRLSRICFQFAFQLGEPGLMQAAMERARKG